MISPIESYILTCDNCKDHFENYEGYAIFADKEAMLYDADNCGWHKEKDKYYCDECAKLDDEIDDKLIIDASRFVADKEDNPPLRMLVDDEQPEPQN